MGFGYRAEPELRELSLTFTNGVTVESLGKRKSQKSLAKLIDVEIGLDKPIGAVGVKIDKTTNSILGLRFLSPDLEVLVQETWEAHGSHDESVWERLEVPPDMALIGFHGVHDSISIRSLGLNVWTANPDAEKVLRDTVRL